MVKYMHAIFLHSSLDTAASGGPFGQLGASIWVSHDNYKKRFAGAIRGYGHWIQSWALCI